VLVARKVILPPLMSVTAFVTSMVTVPVFGFGIRPRGPRIRAIRPILAIWSGVAIAASKLQPAFLNAGDQLVGADHVRAGGLGLGGLVAGSEHDDARGLAGAVRQIDVPRTIWSALRGSTPRRIATSTVASNFTGLVVLAS